MLSDRYSHFQEGPARAKRHYENQLRNAYNEVCCYYAGKKQITSRNEFEPLWNFVKQFAMAQLVNVDGELIRQIDENIEQMRRYELILYACEAYLTPLLPDYLDSVQNGTVHTDDVLVRYVELCAVLSWMKKQNVQQTPELLAAFGQLEAVCVTLYNALCSRRKKTGTDRNALQAVLVCCDKSRLPEVVAQLEATMS